MILLTLLAYHIPYRYLYYYYTITIISRQYAIAFSYYNMSGRKYIYENGNKVM